MKKTPADSAFESLTAHKVKLQAQLEIVESILAGLVDTIGKSPINTIDNQVVNSQKQGYDLKWSYPDKFIFLLQRENRFLHFREAAEFIVQIEGGDTSKVLAKLSSGTHILKKTGVITKFQASKRLSDTFWGSPKWIDKSGSIKERHYFNEKYLHNNSRQYHIELEQDL